MPSTSIAPPDAVIAFDAPQFQHSLYQDFAGRRRDTPVFRGPGQVVYLTRHADCALLMNDRRFVRRPPDGGSNPFGGDGEPNAFEAMIGKWMMFMDPPRHTLVRQAFGAMFKPAAIAPLTAAVESTASELMADIRTAGEADLVTQFAYPLPILVICSLLGVPVEERSLFRRWSAELSRLLDQGSAEDMRAGVPLALEIREYFIQRIQEHDGDDAFGALLAHGRAAGLSTDELAYGCAFLIFAGHETVASLIGNSIVTLHGHPQEHERLRRDARLTASAVEELMRYESPVQKISRWSNEDVMFGDYAVERGTLITALIGAANRDPAVFEEPDRLDLGRVGNPHLAFGKGIHHCLGATLARLELRIALSVLRDALPAFTVTDYRWRRNASLRSLDHIRVRAC